MKYIKTFFYIILLSVLLNNCIYASSNILNYNDNSKSLEIKEEYNDILNLKVNKIDIQEVDNNKLKITGNVNLIEDLNNSEIIAPYNIKKTKNETFNLNDIYIMCFSEIKTFLKTYWYREISNSSNIGIGYIKDNENVIINREYGTGNDNTNQNEEIYTNNQIINCIMGTNITNNINITKEQNSINFIIIIDKEKISKIRYLYIGTNKNIINNSNNISYKSCLSNYIDLLEYYDISKENSSSGLTSSIKNSKNIKNLKETMIPEKTNTLFGEEPATANYVFDKGQESNSASHYYKAKQVGGAWTLENTTYSYGVQNYTLNIKDEKQNIAIATLNEIKMTQDDDYFYFDYDIKYDANNVLYDSTKNIGNGELQTINNGELFLSNKIINNISYDFKTTQGGGSVYGSSLSYNINKYNQSLDFKLNNIYGGTQSIDITNNANAVIDNNVNNPSSNLYCTLKFPFEDYLGPRKIFADTNQWNTSANGSNSHFIFLYLRNQLLFTNGQANYLIPNKLNYNVFENTQYNNDLTKNYWNNRIKGTIKILKDDINNYRYLNMYCPTGLIATKTDNFLYRTYPNYSENINFLVAKEGTNSTNWGCVPSKLTGNSIISNTGIDLLEYINCEHNWVHEVLNENQHITYCSNCKWKHTENHNYEYEYDGLTNNLCKCGWNKHIKHYYSFDSDLITDMEDVVLASSSYTRYNNPLKTGYKFKSFDKYLKYFENMTNPIFNVASTSIIDTYIGEVASMSEISDRFSTTYKAKYDPIKYYIHFNSENNMNLPINTDSINNMECLYDNEYDPPIISYTGYTFRGWSLATNSNIIEIPKREKIKNLTNIEDKIIDVYPVFEVFNYKFKFSTQSNIDKINITQNIDDLICYKDTEYFLPNNIDVIGYNFKGWNLSKLYVPNFGVDFTPNRRIYNYTNTEDKIFTLYPIYEPIKYKFKFSNENINNFTLNSILNDEEFIYDEPKAINNAIKVRGYNLKGWSLKSTQSEPDFMPNEIILNYTSTNNKEFTLYPIYKELSFTIEYRTTIGNYSNGQQVATYSYITNSFNDFIYPEIYRNQKFNNKGKLISENVLSFLGYNTEDNQVFKSYTQAKEYIFDNISENGILVLIFNGRVGVSNYTDDGGGGGSSGGSGSSSITGTINNMPITQIEITEIPVKEITIKVNNKPIKTIKKEQKISKKDLIDLLNEVYSDFKDQNNIKDKTVIYIDDKSYENNKYDIVDFVNDIYSDYTKQYYENYDIVNYINDIYNDFKNQNNMEDNIIIGFTNTEISTKSKIIREININENKENKNSTKKIATNSKINNKDVDENKEEDKTSDTLVKSNDFINKIFNEQDDIKNIEEIITLLNDRNFIEFYENLNNGKYKNTINNFINKYDTTFNKISKELNKTKYKNFDKYMLNILNNEDNKELRHNINKITEQYEEYKDLKSDMLNHNIKQLLIDFNNGKYHNLFSELIPIITDKKHNNFQKTINYEIIEGENADISYDLIYYLFDTIYNYKEPKKIEETETIVETTKTIEETSEEIVEEVNGKENNLLIVAGLGLLIALIIGLIVFLVIKSKNKKKGEYGYE